MTDANNNYAESAREEVHQMGLERDMGNISIAADVRQARDNMRARTAPLEAAAVSGAVQWEVVPVEPTVQPEQLQSDNNAFASFEDQARSGVDEAFRDVA